jgi:hypothetical protein
MSGAAPPYARGAASSPATAPLELCLVNAKYTPMSPCSIFQFAQALSVPSVLCRQNERVQRTQVIPWRARAVLEHKQGLVMDLVDVRYAHG